MCYTCVLVGLNHMCIKPYDQFHSVAHLSDGHVFRSLAFRKPELDTAFQLHAGKNLRVLRKVSHHRRVLLQPRLLQLRCKVFYVTPVSCSCHFGNGKPFLGDHRMAFVTETLLAAFLNPVGFHINIWAWLLLKPGVGCVNHLIFMEVFAPIHLRPYRIAQAVSHAGGYNHTRGGHDMAEANRWGISENKQS